MCKESSSRGEERILDTWMDSSISAYFIQKYSMNKSINSIQELFKGKEFICDLRPSGKEIIRTWLHYSMLRGHLLFKKPMFQHIWISGHVMEKKGEKMSKSKGNIIEPEPIIEKYGADALRLFGASETKLGSDMKFSEEKLRGMSKFLTKLYNISKFISSFENPLNQDFDLNQLANIDKWIINQLHKIFEQSSNKGYNKYDFSIPANLLRHFTKEIFSSHYLELIKHRLYQNNIIIDNEQLSACYTMYYCLQEILKFFSPIIPFITDYLYRELFLSSINNQIWSLNFKIYMEIPEEANDFLLNFNSDIWAAKRKFGLKLREKIKLDKIPNQLLIFKNDLINMHKIDLRDLEDSYLTTKKLNLKVKK